MRGECMFSHCSVTVQTPGQSVSFAHNGRILKQESLIGLRVASGGEPIMAAGESLAGDDTQERRKRASCKNLISIMEE